MKNKLTSWLYFVFTLVAAAIGAVLTNEGSALAFVGWMIFYLSFQVPTIFYLSKEKNPMPCTRFFSRR
jgi:lipopolysaccharide export LptBFGC system permease protein LptF